VDMDISMDIHGKSVDMDMDGKFHIHGKPGPIPARDQRGLDFGEGAVPFSHKFFHCMIMRCFGCILINLPL